MTLALNIAGLHDKMPGVAAATQIVVNPETWLPGVARKELYYVGASIVAEGRMEMLFGKCIGFWHQKACLIVLFSTGYRLLSAVCRRDSDIDPGGRSINQYACRVGLAVVKNLAKNPKNNSSLTKLLQLAGIKKRSRIVVP